MKKYILILILFLFTGCLQQMKDKVSSSLINTAIRISPEIADSSYKTITINLPEITLMEEGYLQGITDTIIVGDSSGRSEVILTTVDSNCIGKVIYDVKYIRDSVEIELDCPTLVLDTTDWKLPYERLSKELEVKKEKLKRIRIIAFILLLISIVLGILYKINTRSNAEK